MSTSSRGKGRTITILMAEDDLDDQVLTRDAFDEAHFANQLRFVNDGEELMAYLRNQDVYADPARYPRPGLILLDLNMPRKDGREALQEIKADPRLSSIPVVVMTTSKSDEDILASYQAGVSSFIRKPITFEKMIEVIRALTHYWLEIVELPEVN
jgi:CheY-like chemotaxis protein